MSSAAEIHVTRDGHVARVVLSRPPHNFVDAEVMRRLAETLLALDHDHHCRAIVLASGVGAFCAGADFSGSGQGEVASDPAAFYTHAMKLYRNRKPIVAAVAGAAIGAGLGLALMADFRVTCAEARFSANFNRLGFHPGFGLSLTLPRLVGEQQAALLFYTGRRITGTEAAGIGLADQLVARDEVDASAMALAQEIAASAPLAVETTRATLREGLADRIAEVNQRELAIQRGQFRSEDFREGVAAMAGRRAPVFQRR
ncbi:enoyl-CoA hydratase/isomerase family protein [Cupriavidus taiwanensis]|uniref:enoyl-CoA hydratase/isomerase family protein n=1 Tax=Cupriavidus taiwanensis TaxID=164546 RepID=UPI000E10E363|nr:enoyl-CoA hydratase/isomerase family protein [Cupriavidus taiwanensis]SOY72775.1 Enoyl-CoA hydratase [Cupriavidus taiwanensis]SOY73012.1 Enoyl-CoA hydratase [Cupriavidus taiwanensis]SOY97002.1 Enoyl-CoA hydratase [Cupriavidus taiwanensis]SOZ66877.1 Enoyl-CoA hydratase [Cupriavidus taiwanensis]SOZ84115.1 Enoyl-CoA hydratase [Cupriavidus taiwanensis]